MSAIDSHEPRGERWLAAAGLLLMVWVVVPVVVPMLPGLYLDTDPRLIDRSIAGASGVEAASNATLSWGPRGSAWWAVVGVVLAMSAWIAATLGGVKPRWVSIGLVLLGVTACVYHMQDLWEDRLRCGLWASGAVVALSILHVGQFQLARRWMVAVLIGSVAVIAADAAYAVLVEHAYELRYYEANKQQVLAQQNIEPGSIQQALYERRMRYPDATGAFGLSNVLASIIGAITLLALAVSSVMLASWFTQRREESSDAKPTLWRASIIACGGFAGLYTLWLTHSTGGLLAMLIAGGVGFVCLTLIWVAKSPQRDRAALPPRDLKRGGGLLWVLPWLGLAAVLFAVMAVFVRGGMGPPLPPPDGPGVDGERSLLFRFQYWSAAWQIIQAAPWLGVGPGGFSDAYLWAKDPLNPETVQSTHNFAVDWWVMLGLPGLAWTAAVLLWLVQAIRGFAITFQVERQAPKTAISPFSSKASAYLAIASVGVLLIVSWPVLSGGFYAESALVWLASLAAMAGVIYVVMTWHVLKPWVLQFGLALAALVLLVHNTIEMTYFISASAGLAWAVVALAGSGYATQYSERSAHQQSKPAMLSVSLIALICVAGSVGFAVSVERHEDVAEAAAKTIYRGDRAGALQQLENLQQVSGYDPQALQWRVRLTAIEPLLMHPEPTNLPGLQTAVDDAGKMIEQVIEEGTASAASYRLLAQLHEQAGRTLGHRKDLDRAVEAYRELQNRSPYNIRDRLNLADLYAELGQHNEATETYREVLKLRDQHYLDPADPLSTDQLQRIEAYLSAAE
jgi:hypothetical protein